MSGEHRCGGTPLTRGYTATFDTMVASSSSWTQIELIYNILLTIMVSLSFLGSAIVLWRLRKRKPRGIFSKDEFIDDQHAAARLSDTLVGISYGYIAKATIYLCRLGGELHKTWLSEPSYCPCVLTMMRIHTGSCPVIDPTCLLWRHAGLLTPVLDLSIYHTCGPPGQKSEAHQRVQTMDINGQHCFLQRNAIPHSGKHPYHAHLSFHSSLLL